MPDTLIVTATLGDRKSLTKTIDSVAEIGGKRVKHVLIAPANRIARLRAEFPKYEILPEPNQAGIYVALNYGLTKCVGEFKYLGYINDDDYWLPAFQQLFDSLDNSPQFDVAYGRVTYVDPQCRLIGESTSSPRIKAFFPLLARGIPLFTQQATLIRRELFIKLSGFDTNYKLIADTDFWLRSVFSGSNFKYLNSLCAAYSIHDEQLSAQTSLQKREHEELLRRYGKPLWLKCCFEEFLFRVWNLPIYIKRFYFWKSFKAFSRNTRWLN